MIRPWPAPVRSSATTSPPSLTRSIAGGSVTVYNSAGTTANLQLRWAKTDSVANGGADTWELFYQTDSNATGANPAWQNAGVDFVFDASGQLNPAITTIALTGVTINGIALGNITLNSPTGAITQFASSNGDATVNNMQQNGYGAGQLQSIAVGNNGNINGTFSNGQSVALAQIPLVHFNSPDNLKALTGGAFQETSRIRHGAERRGRPDRRASRWNAPTPISRPSSPS